MMENLLIALHFAAMKHKDQRSYISAYTDPHFNYVIGLVAALTDVAGETDPVLRGNPYKAPLGGQRQPKTISKKNLEPKLPHLWLL